MTHAAARRDLSREERLKLRAELIGEDAQNALAFETRATRRFGPAAGPLLRQLLFWDGRGDAGSGWTYKSRREMERETGLNQRHQEAARKVLRGAGVLEEDVRPVGKMKRPTLRYRLDLHALMGALHPVSGTGRAENDVKNADSQEKHGKKPVSGTGQDETAPFSADLQVKQAESPVSGTGNDETNGFSRGLQHERDKNDLSSMQKSTSEEIPSKENKQCVEQASDAAWHTPFKDGDDGAGGARSDHADEDEARVSAKARVCVGGLEKLLVGRYGVGLSDELRERYERDFGAWFREKVRRFREGGDDVPAATVRRMLNRIAARWDALELKVEAAEYDVRLNRDIGREPSRYEQPVRAMWGRRV
jgi:hypothetical protein